MNGESEVGDQYVENRTASVAHREAPEEDLEAPRMGFSLHVSLEG